MKPLTTPRCHMHLNSSIWLWVTGQDQSHELEKLFKRCYVQIIKSTNNNTIMPIALWPRWTKYGNHAKKYQWCCQSLYVTRPMEQQINYWVDIFNLLLGYHDDVINWKPFLRFWSCVREIHQAPVNSPHKVTRSFDVFFDMRLNKRLSKQSRCWWFETTSCSSWRHYNASLDSIRSRRRFFSNEYANTKWELYWLLLNWKQYPKYRGK